MLPLPPTGPSAHDDAALGEPLTTQTRRRWAASWPRTDGCRLDGDDPGFLPSSPLASPRQRSIDTCFTEQRWHPLDQKSEAAIPTRGRPGQRFETAVPSSDGAGLSCRPEQAKARASRRGPTSCCVGARSTTSWALRWRGQTGDDGPRTRTAGTRHETATASAGERAAAWAANGGGGSRPCGSAGQTGSGVLASALWAPSVSGPRCSTPRVRMAPSVPDRNDATRCSDQSAGTLSAGQAPRAFPAEKKQGTSDAPFCRRRRDGPRSLS